MINHRHLGSSGLKVSEITYGNWLTHGSQIENDVATACVHAALEAGITTFDTADVYANGRAEEVLGAALKGQRRSALEIFTKVYWPIGKKGPNDTGLSPTLGTPTIFEATGVRPDSSNSFTSGDTAAQLWFICSASGRVARFHTNSPVCSMLFKLSLRPTLENPMIGGM